MASFSFVMSFRIDFTLSKTPFSRSSKFFVRVLLINLSCSLIILLEFSIYF